MGSIRSTIDIVSWMGEDGKEQLVSLSSDFAEAGLVVRRPKK